MTWEYKKRFELGRSVDWHRGPETREGERDREKQIERERETEQGGLLLEAWAGAETDQNASSIQIVFKNKRFICVGAAHAAPSLQPLCMGSRRSSVPTGAGRNARREGSGTGSRGRCRVARVASHRPTPMWVRGRRRRRRRRSEAKAEEEEEEAAAPCGMSPGLGGRSLGRRFLGGGPKACGAGVAWGSMSRLHANCCATTD
ncbi:unnamed protein product [Prorocentrum cordatum]|uniref:Uncharacterized protein n=1 Tax=Prorocentrum cordatum TaxID=2364126 RepID=A0ABN9R817_9DINO|nr:unnamed protein product [Polarella glacialis]